MQGGWDKSATGSREVRGKTLGIVGYGNIGSQLAALAEAMGMRVIYPRSHRQAAARQHRAGRAASRSCWRKSDVVTLHVPETPETHGHDRRNARSR